MAASLPALVSALEDDPYCGTRPPHWPGGPLRLGSLQDIIATRFNAVGLNPQPLPRSAARVFQQVRLFQLGQSLQARAGAAADLGGALSGFASESFDDWGEGVPISVLIAWLLHRGPPRANGGSEATAALRMTCNDNAGLGPAFFMRSRRRTLAMSREWRLRIRRAKRPLRAGG